MRVNLLYFAVFKERLGMDSESVDIAEQASVAQLVELLATRHAAISALRGKFRVAVNQSMVGDDHILGEGDEVALIPPVAGGTAPHAKMVDEPPSLDRLIAQVMTREMGGLVTFVGVVRKHSRGQEIVRLEYEAYAGMAEREMTALCLEIEQEWDGVRIAVEHRAGVLGIGDIAVAIACAAPHRAEAFAGCRAMIDRLKERVPIWKKEISEDGAEWIGLGP